MKISAVLIVSLTSLALVSCGKKSPELTTSTTSDGATKVAPEPFKGAVYRSSNDSVALTLISPDEAEYSTGGQTFLCKYTRQDGRIRMILTAFGSNQVLYFRETSVGLSGNDGTSLLSADQYAAVKEQRRQAQQAEMRRQQDQQRKRQEAEQAKRDEQARVARLIEDSKKSTKVLGEFMVQSSGWGNSHPQKLILRDSGLEVQHQWDGGFTRQCDFVYYWSRFSTGPSYWQLTFHNPNPTQSYIQETFVFGSEAECNKFESMFFQALKDWAGRNPEAFRQFEHKYIP